MIYYRFMMRYEDIAAKTSERCTVNISNPKCLVLATPFSWGFLYHTFCHMIPSSFIHLRGASGVISL